ncbi:MAG: glycosyltransferase family 2 protein [Woeseiaceae bacterium]
MLSEITPVILTFNEAPNIERTLAMLAWARSIVVVDSYSTDNTLALLKAEPRVRLFQHKFDSHAAQWTFAVGETGIATPWILALDADYVLSPALVAELGALQPDPGIDAYRARFEFYVRGRRLWGSLYPPVAVLFRRGRAAYVQDGHAQRLQVTGAVGELRAPIAHDDRKPFAHWRKAQRRYAELEARKLRDTPWASLRWPDRLRRLIVVAPVAVPFYCLVLRGGLVQGVPGWTYAFQRTWSEIAIVWALLRRERGDGL